MEYFHTLYTAIIVAIGGLLFIALYWLARSDRALKELALASLKGSTQIEYAANMIASQRARIAELEAEVAELETEIAWLSSWRASNVIDLPRNKPRDDRA